jgi:NADH-quinone oxidoreductase subunit H
MPVLAEWYDLRDLGNAVGAFLDWIRDQGAPDWVPYVVSGLIGVVAILLWVILSQLAFIWIERRVIGRMQSRIGPNRVGPQGLLQPIADTIKLFLKEAITGRKVDRTLFWAGPVLIFMPALAVLAVIPFGSGMFLTDLNVGVLFVIAVASVNTVAVFVAGWASNNKFALIGAMRTVAMLISYELIQVLALLGVVVFAGSMRMGAVVDWQSDFNTWVLFLQPLAFLSFVIASAVEIGRSPMDISEAESEIVARRRVHSGVRRLRHHCDVVPGWLDRLGPGGVGARLAAVPREAVSRLLPVHLDPRHPAAAAHRPVDGLRLEVPAAACAAERPGVGWRGVALARG